MMKKIGIMGGTFNPIHCGHLFIAEEVMSDCFLDEIIFVPTGTPPHKNNKEILDGKIRYDLVNKAILGNKNFKVSDIEIKRSGYSYSVDTLKELNERYDKTQFYFILGADAFLYLKKWKNIDKLNQYCSFIVVARPGYDKELLLEESELLNTKYNINSQIIDIDGINISSTTIRERIRLGKSIKYLVPKNIIIDILENKLYG